MTTDRWADAEAAGLDALGLLVYRSQLLGADPTLSNFGGGNTSVKRTVTDFRGRETPALTVKGTGADLATITPAGFADLRLEDLQPLRDHGALTDEAMVEYLSHCLLRPGGPRPSIETLLHAFLPATHIDHVHANVSVALATTERGEELLRELTGDDAVWVPYHRPGFGLAKAAIERIAAQPKARYALLQKHGLVTWAEDAKECYQQSIEFLNQAEAFIADRAQGSKSFGGVAIPPLAQDERHALAEAALPGLRGLLCPPGQRMTLHYDDSPEALEFAGSQDGPALARSGLALPDHVLYTRVLPLVVDAAPTPDALVDAARTALEAYQQDYARFYAAHSGPEDSMLDPTPTIVVAPGLGVIAAGRDARTARTASECYRRAIAIMRDAEVVDRFQPLTEAEAFQVEYWPLERYKLSLQPRPGELAGRVAFITGGASGIGAGLARRFAAAGAQVVVADINQESAASLCAELASSYGEGVALAVRADVTSEADLQQAMSQTVRAYGGLDILVCNAGVGFSKPIQETSLADWSRTLDILTTGYFLTSREGIRVMRGQRSAAGEPLGGSVLFVASKAGLAAAKDASAYATAKAAVLHLARCLVEEVSADAIRVNSLAPDAVIQGSGFWAGQWGQARAEAHGVAMDDLASFYKGRNMLKVSVTAEDVAEAALFLVSDRSQATTGAILTVDGGLHDGYVR